MSARLHRLVLGGPAKEERDARSSPVAAHRRRRTLSRTAAAGGTVSSLTAIPIWSASSSPSCCHGGKVWGEEDEVEGRGGPRASGGSVGGSLEVLAGCGGELAIA